MTTPWQPGFQGTTVVPAGYNDPHNYSPVSALQLVGTTGAAGFALQNATPTLLTWTAPNDNQLHQVIIIASQNVTSLETGGAVGVSGTDPSGGTFTPVLFAGGGAAGLTNNAVLHLVASGGTLTVKQTSNLTAGAATVWVQVWAA